MIKWKTVTVFRRDVFLFAFLLIMLGAILSLLIVSSIPTSISNMHDVVFVTNNTEINTLALNITKDCDERFLNEWCITNSINHWIYDNIEYTDRDRFILDDRVSITLSRREGVCRHNAILGCSMIESLGLDCRINTYRNIRNNEHKQHAWFEVDVSDGNTDYIIICDATNNRNCDFVTLNRYIEKYDEPVFG